MKVQFKPASKSQVRRIKLMAIQEAPELTMKEVRRRNDKRMAARKKPSPDDRPVFILSKTRGRGGPSQVLLLPWDKLEVGQSFFAPIREGSPQVPGAYRAQLCQNLRDLKQRGHHAQKKEYMIINAEHEGEKGVRVYRWK